MNKKGNNYYSRIQEASISSQNLGFKTRLQYIAGRSADSRLPSNPKEFYKENWAGWRNFLGLNTYYSYGEASKRSQSLGFLTASQYRSQRRRDIKLPAHPDRYYRDEWSGWPIFLGLRQEKYYPSLSEASEAAQKLGFSSMIEYRVGCKQDPRLPVSPREVYKEEWRGSDKFLAKKEKKFYTTLDEASRAALFLGLSSSEDYKNGYRQDDMLPSSPEKMYAKEWKDWGFFFKKTKNTYYITYQEASKAAQRLGIKTGAQYKKLYRLDPQLHSSPWVKYASDWTGMGDFLGIETASLYENLEQASQAACELGFSTMVEYRAGRDKDPRLPSDPSQFYKNEWKSVDHFLNKKTIKLYPQINQASRAARKLGFETSGEYTQNRFEDPQLPACPNEVYRDSWCGWSEFLGTKNKYYPTYIKASESAQILGFKTMKEYREGRYKDPRLPSSPDTFYSRDWKGAYHFLSKPKNRFYKTLKEASEAAQNLGITSLAEYKSTYSQDERLTSVPWRVYSKEWKGFSDFIGKPTKEPYKNLGDASIAAQNLGISSCEDYREKRARDPRLPASPNRIYDEDWPGWKIFLGKNKKYYASLKEASEAVRRLKIKTMVEYRARYREDSKLPPKPERLYPDWVDSKAFLGSRVSRFYLTLKQASDSVGKLGLSTAKEYSKGRHVDPKLPASPHVVYRDEWCGWRDFLCEPKIKHYSTLLEASSAVQALGIKSMDEYARKRSIDPLLPSNPNQYYSNEWEGNANFFGKDSYKFYPTLSEASSAAQKLGFKTNAEYKAGCHKDPKLPVNPERTYSGEWEGMKKFLGKESVEYYETIDQASKSVRALGFTSIADYKAFRFKDPFLPRAPNQYYSEKWVSWQQFMLPAEYLSLADVKAAVKILGIKDSKNYREMYKAYPPLPPHPDRMFKGEWVDWYDLCDIPRPYSYDEAVALIAPEKLSSKREYIDFINKTDDPRMPKTPDQVYKAQWVNWYVYLGTLEPYRLKNIRSPYTQWAECIKEFLKGARGGRTKESHLCRFVRYYIQAHEMGESPQKFLTLENIAVP